MSDAPRTLWVDVSTSRPHAGTPHGIVRVESGLARALARLSPATRPVWVEAGRVVAGGPEQLAVSDGRDSTTPSFTSGPGLPEWSRTELVGGIAALQDLGPRARLHVSAVLAASTLPAPVGSRLVSSRARMAEWVRARAASRASASTIDPSISAWHPGPRDVLLVTGADWELGAVRAWSELPAARRPRLWVLVHDILPVTRPELLCNPFMAGRFDEWLEAVCRGSDGLLTVSAATHDELTRYAGRRGWPLPPATVVPPAAELHRVEGVRPEGVPDEPYVVYVSTIERRKNHATLVAAARGAAERGQRLPVIVFAGSWGWGVDDLHRELDLDESLVGRVVVMDGLDDARLRWLVEHSLAAVVASRFEGFGMPAAEARSLGVPLLASDIPAHCESAGPDVTLLDPYDTGAWREALAAALADPPQRRAPVTRSWDDAAAEVLAAIEGSGTP